jgi:hypothetical protein
MTPRLSGSATPEGSLWFNKLARARRKLESAERERDEIAREALKHGLGIRGVAEALGVDKTTAQRRYGGRTRREA